MRKFQALRGNFDRSSGRKTGRGTRSVDTAVGNDMATRAAVPSHYNLQSLHFPVNGSRS